jgi:hypothetical protein
MSSRTSALRFRRPHLRTVWLRPGFLVAVFLAAGAARAASPTATPVGPVQPVAPVAAAPVATDPGEVEDQEWKFVTRLSLAAGYDDNLFIQPSGGKDDYFLRIAPSFAIGIGYFRTEIAPFAPIPHLLARTGEEDLPRKNFAFASYTPNAVLFSKYSHENALNHDFRAAARKDREIWAAQGEFHFQQVTDTEIELGRRTRQTYYDANARGLRQLTGKIAGTLGVQEMYSDFSGGLWSSDTRGSAGLDYQVGGKTKIGGGVTGGYLQVARGGNQTYQQPFVRLEYLPTGKLSFTGRFGAEFRQFDSDVGDRSRFVYDLTGEYRPADGTLLSLSSRRDTQASAQFADENILENFYQGSLRQRFLQRTYVSLAGGLVRRTYEQNRTVTPPFARRDHYYFGRVSASRDVTEHGTVELGYEHRENDSSLSTFDFSQNVATLSASFLF